MSKLRRVATEEKLCREANRTDLIQDLLAILVVV
jgi:hypothetical protein